MPKVPKFIIRLLFGQMADLVLEGVKVSNQKIIDVGFEFEYTQLDKLFDKLYLKSNQ